MDDGDNPVPRLVRAAANGDEQAWQEIVTRYGSLLASVIRRFRLTAAETQDVAQTVWLRLVEHLDGIREPRALPMWIVTTTRREALRCLADRRRAVPYDPLDPAGLAPPADETEPAAGLIRAERHAALLAGLAELPARQRELLLLLMEDPPLSYHQISRRTGIPVGSIGPTRGRAMDRLRQTPAVRDQMTGPAPVPAGSAAVACLDRPAARHSDRPGGR